jgi:ferredoxin
VLLLIRGIKWLIYCGEKMNWDKVIFYCFSGTGNTLSAVNKMAEVFEGAGKSVNIYKIPDDPWVIESHALYIFAFPVYEFGVPGFVQEWIDDLPVNEVRLPAAALSTMAGRSGFVKTPLKKVLLAKNFEPVAVKEIIFPSNFIYFQSESEVEKVMKVGLIRAERYADDLLAGRGDWPRKSIISTLLFPFNRLGSKCFSWVFSHYKVGDSCTHCGLCEKNCPVNNIKVTEKSVEWGRRCQVCLRCINNCPHNAIRSRVCNFLYRKHYKV